MVVREETGLPVEKVDLVEVGRHVALRQHSEGAGGFQGRHPHADLQRQEILCRREVTIASHQIR